MTAAPRLRRRRNGFTLIEALATITILGVLGSLTSFVTLTVSDGLLEASTAAQAHVELSTGMDRMVRELRKIRLDSSASGLAPDITSVNATLVTWASPGGSNSIWKSGSVLLLRKDSGAWDQILTDVSSMTVKTYDESNTELATTLSGAACDPIRRISLEITVQRYGASETLRSRVFLRSTMAGAVY